MHSHPHDPTQAWSEDDSREFLDYGKYFVPDRDLQMGIICELIPSYAASEHVVELCCGEGLLSERILDGHSNAVVDAFDGSPAMIRRARARLERFGKRFRASLFELSATSWRQSLSHCTAVVSSLAIHHLSGAEKQLLFRDVGGILRDGGAFIIADIVLPASPLATRLASQLWHQSVRRVAFELDGDLGAYQRFQSLQWDLFSAPEPDPVDKPSPIIDQLNGLRDAGFKSVDVFWMTAGHAIFGGYK